MNLIELLKLPEGKTLEFKRDLSSTRPLLRTVVAFANTSGGTILVGVEDDNHEVRGLEDARQDEERVANLISDAVSPQLIPDLELLSYRGSSVLAIRIHPSSSRPHYLGNSPETGTYVRVGSTDRQADHDLLAEMRRFSKNEFFDESPMPELSSEAIDFNAASESFSEYKKLSERDLDTLGLFTYYQNRRVPTVGGILLYGKDRSGHFPDAWIQAGRFAGTDKSRIIDQAEFRHSLPELIDQAFAFVERHIATAVEFQGTRRIARWSVPAAVVREALVNAVAHADYSQRGAPLRVSIFDDRLEVENPGLLPFGITLDDLPLGVSKLRNRVIGRVFHELRLIENWGSGVQRMIAACKEGGLAPPVWEEIGTRFRVTVFTKRSTEVQTDEVDSSILDVLAEGEGHRTGDIASAIKLSTRSTRTHLSKLVELGLVIQVGKSLTDPKRKYYLA